MRQALCIFRKDVRHLRAQLATALALTAILGWLEAQIVAFADVVAILWVLCWTWLMAAAIHEERLPGDRQYWLTRPFDWRSLLLAKCLFFAAFAWLPLAASGAFSLLANGVSPLRFALPLLAQTAIFAGAVGIPAGALAAVTGGLAQLLWGFLLLAGAGTAAFLAAGTRRGIGWDSVEWVRWAAVGALILAAAVAILLLQYARRKTPLSRGVLAAAAAITAAAPFANAWHGAWTLQTRLADRPQGDSGVRLTFDQTPRPRMRYATAPYFSGPLDEGIYIPLRLEGLPRGAAVVSERVAGAIEAGGRSWTSDWTPAAGLTGVNPLEDVHLLRADGACWQYLNVDRRFYQEVKDLPARMHVSIALILFIGPDGTTLQPSGRTARLPGEGICQVSSMPSPVRRFRDMRSLLALCGWPIHAPGRAYIQSRSRETGVTSTSLLGDFSRGYFFRWSIWDAGAAELSATQGPIDLNLETWRTAAYLERQLDTPEIRLRDYVGPRATDPL
jgi:hypothetical protein